MRRRLLLCLAATGAGPRLLSPKPRPGGQPVPAAGR
jgi:hypothetical protein